MEQKEKVIYFRGEVFQWCKIPDEEVLTIIINTYVKNGRSFQVKFK